jgi:hypothetical protein
VEAGRCGTLIEGPADPLIEGAFAECGPELANGVMLPNAFDPGGGCGVELRNKL